jgi:hypothetical protein
VLATAYKRCSGHSEITGDLSSGHAAFDQADSASNLTVSDPERAATKILPGFSAFGDGIGDAFALDLVFPLRGSGHNREQHGPHWYCTVHIASTEVQHAQAGPTHMHQPSPRRLNVILTSRFYAARLLPALLCAAAVLTGSVSGVTAADGDQQVNLSLKPVDQPGAFFSLKMDPGQSRELKAELRNHGSAAIATRTYAADGYTLINGGFGAKDRDSTPTGATSWLTYPSEVLELPAVPYAKF